MWKRCACGWPLGLCVCDLDGTRAHRSKTIFFSLFRLKQSAKQRMATRRVWRFVLVNLLFYFYFYFLKRFDHRQTEYAQKMVTERFEEQSNRISRHTIVFTIGVLCWRMDLLSHFTSATADSMKLFHSINFYHFYFSNLIWFFFVISFLFDYCFFTVHLCWVNRWNWTMR